MTTQKEIRAAFWNNHLELAAAARASGTISKGQNSQTCTCRSTFVEYVDALERSGEISTALADRATL